jgi:hypothetical protein
MKIAKSALGAALTALLLSVAVLAAAAWAGDLNPREEAALFSLADLGSVDLSTKTVSVEVYVSPDAELAACSRMLPLVWERVEQFYARLGVKLVQRPGGPQPGDLAPAKRLRVELLTDKEWLNRSFKAFEVPPPFRLRFLQVCKSKCAFAHLPLSTVQISFKRFQQAELSRLSEADGRNRDWLANLLIHELGHLLGLYHAYEFTNDDIPEILADKTANFMSQRIAGKAALGFVELQRRLVHSYLGGGKVFQQYQQVNFDPLRYLELVKLHNGYQEPLKKVGKMAHKVKRQGKAKTFNDDDDEEDED